MIMHVVEREKLTCPNENGRHTWKRGAREATLHLTWTTTGEEKRWEWRLSDQDTGFDYAQTRTRYDMEGRHTWEKTSRLNYRGTDWDKVKEEIETQNGQKEEEWRQARENDDHNQMTRILPETMQPGIEVGTRKK